MTAGIPTGQGEARGFGLGSAPEIVRRLEQFRDLRAAMLDLPRTARATLGIFVEGCKASRGSLIMVNPLSGRPHLVAGVGLPEDVIGKDLPPARRRISDWVFREKRSVILQGEVRDSRFDGVEPRGGIESAISLPLIGMRGAIGVLNLARQSPFPPFADADIAEAEALVEPLAVVLEEVEELSWARRGWRELQTLAIGGPDRGVVMRSTARYQVAIGQIRSPLVAGDLIERVPDHSGGQTLMVADVSGHGSAALAAGSLIQGLFLAHAQHTRSPGELARLIHESLLDRWAGTVHATAWFAHFSSNGLMVSCNAGYPEPLCVPMDDEPRWFTTGGPMLGAAKGAFYEQDKVQLMGGDILLAVSDGVLRAQDAAGQELGDAWVEELAVGRRREPIEKLVADVCEGALTHAGVRQPADDFTVLGVRYSREA